MIHALRNEPARCDDFTDTAKQQKRKKREEEFAQLARPRCSEALRHRRLAALEAWPIMDDLTERRAGCYRLGTGEAAQVVKANVRASYASRAFDQCGAKYVLNRDRTSAHVSGGCSVIRSADAPLDTNRILLDQTVTAGGRHDRA